MFATILSVVLLTAAKRGVLGLDDSDCPTGYKFYANEGLCVGVELEEESQRGALDRCKSSLSNPGTMSLVTPHNRTYFNWLRSTFPVINGQQFWLGVDDRATDGKFVWMDGETYNGWAPWHPGHPELDPGVACVRWHNEYWEHDDCTKERDVYCLANNAPHAHCASQFTQIPGFSSYFGVFPKMAAELAHQQCETCGAWLAIIDNKTVFDAVFVNLLGSDPDGWIGLNDTIEKFSFKWPDGRYMDYPWWMGMMADNYDNGKDCFYVSGEIWKDVECTEDDNIYVLCQFKPLECPLKQKTKNLTSAYIKKTSNKVYPHDIQSSFTTRNFHHCTQACLIHQNCGSFNYSPNSGTCQLVRSCNHTLVDMDGFDHWQ